MDSRNNYTQKVVSFYDHNGDVNNQMNIWLNKNQKCKFINVTPLYEIKYHIRKYHNTHVGMFAIAECYNNKNTTNKLLCE